MWQASVLISGMLIRLSLAVILLDGGKVFEINPLTSLNLSGSVSELVFSQKQMLSSL